MTLMIVGAVVAATLIALFVYAVLIYNGFIALKNNIDKAFHNIDVLLKQRFEEIPRLVEVCKGYMQHERETLALVTAARGRVAGAGVERDIFSANGEMTRAISGLFARVEDYPELKADGAFQKLAKRISQLEDQIADRRELYNEFVTIYNTRLEAFPDVLVARMFAFPPRIFWNIKPGERFAPDVSITG